MSHYDFSEGDLVEYIGEGYSHYGPRKGDIGKVVFRSNVDSWNGIAVRFERDIGSDRLRIFPGASIERGHGWWCHPDNLRHLKPPEGPSFEAAPTGQIDDLLFS